MVAILDLAHTVNRTNLVDKHLGDFSCPGTHWLHGSQKLPQHPFVNGSTGEVLDYRGCKVLATLYFMAKAFIGADDQSSPSPLYLRPNKKIQSTRSELSRFDGHQFGDRRDLNPGPPGLQSSVLTTRPHGHTVWSSGRRTNTRHAN